MDHGITLEISSYCSFCPDFEPIVEKLDITSMDDQKQKVRSIVKCENENRCAMIYERFKNSKTE